MHRTARLFSLAVVALSTTACSSVFRYALGVTVADNVELVGGSRVVMTKGELPDDPSLLEPLEDSADIRTGEREYAGEGGVCCSTSGERVNLFAFIDLNANEVWDEGEPWGADPNNPVHIDDDDYHSSIVVEEAAQD